MTGRYLAAAFEALLDILQTQEQPDADAPGGLKQIAADLLQLGALMLVR